MTVAEAIGLTLIAVGVCSVPGCWRSWKQGSRRRDRA